MLLAPSNKQMWYLNGRQQTNEQKRTQKGHENKKANNKTWNIIEIMSEMDGPL